MVDFQVAEKKRLEELVYEIGLEPLCAIVNVIFNCLLVNFLFYHGAISIGNLLSRDSFNIVFRLTATYTAMILRWS